jgi:hypothetical protein
MSEIGQLSSQLGMKVAMQQLDAYLRKRGVDEDTRNMIVNSMEMMYEYIPYTIAQKKDPTDGKVLAEFMLIKGTKMAKYLGTDSAKCGAAIVEFLLSANKAYASTATAFPPAITLAYGLAVLDLIEVGNSCEFAQKAYYEAFIREHTVKLEPIRARVQSTVTLSKP